jgi:formate hydrogenlyase transcriptional activator
MTNPSLPLPHIAQRSAVRLRIEGRPDRTLVLTLYLQAYDWPGNIRELQNVVERAVILCDAETIAIDEVCLLPEPRRASRPQVPLAATLVDKESEMIVAALGESHGRISGPSGAAGKLGIPRTTLESRIRTLRIDKHHFKGAGA